MITALSLKLILESKGYVVSQIIDRGRNAAKTIKKIKPDLIFMDILLADQVDGIEVIEQLRQESDTPVIFITASTDTKTVEKIGALNAAGVVFKPFVWEDIESVLESMLKK